MVQPSNSTHESNAPVKTITNRKEGDPHQFNEESVMLLLLSTNGAYSGIFSLPSDIITSVFSYLDQETTLSCMAVCRFWYENVPQYTEQTWKTLRLDERDVHIHHQRRERCLGKHVKTVIFNTIQDQTLYTLMEKVLEWGCSDIKYLVFKDCVTDNEDAFLDKLESITPGLTHLKMLRHGTAIPPLKLLERCQKTIANFTYHILPSAYKDEAESANGEQEQQQVLMDKKQPASSMDSSLLFSNLTYLCLDAVYAKDYLEPFLQRCPNLRSFLGASRKTVRAAWNFFLPELSIGIHFDRIYSSSSISFHELLRWCPKITNVLDFSTYNGVDLDEDEFSSTDTSRHHKRLGQQQQGFQYFGLVHDSHASAVRMIPEFLATNQTTLEYFVAAHTLDTANETIENSSRMLQSLCLTKLHTLEIFNICLDAMSIVVMLNQSPVLIDFTWMGPLTGTPTIRFDTSALQQLQYCTRLRVLWIGGITFDGNHTVLTQMVERFPSLRALTLRRINSHLILPRVFEYHKSLVHLDLCSAHWSHLDADGDASTFNNNDNSTTIQQSANAEEETTTTTTTSACLFRRVPAHRMNLQILCLKALPGVSDDMLLALARIPTLKYVEVLTNPESTTEEGLCRFIQLLGTATKIESLQLHNLREITNKMFDALSSLPYLKEYHTLIPQENESCRVYLSGLVRWLLSKSTTNLQSFFVNKVTLVASSSSSDEQGETLEVVMSKDEVDLVMQQKLPQYNVKFFEIEQFHVLQITR